MSLAAGPPELETPSMLDIQTLIVLAAALVLLISGLLALRWVRPRHPEDLAFWAFARFGPTLRLPAPDRVRRVVPAVDDATLQRWLTEFASVEREIWRLAELGGPAKLGHKAVRDSLQQTFPFLVGRGLRQAQSLVAYYAWHEGYDR